MWAARQGVRRAGGERAAASLSRRALSLRERARLRRGVRAGRRLAAAVTRRARIRTWRAGSLRGAPYGAPRRVLLKAARARWSARVAARARRRALPLEEAVKRTLAARALQAGQVLYTAVPTQPWRRLRVTPGFGVTGARTTPEAQAARVAQRVQRGLVPGSYWMIRYPAIVRRLIQAKALAGARRRPRRWGRPGSPMGRVYAALQGAMPRPKDWYPRSRTSRTSRGARRARRLDPVGLRRWLALRGLRMPLTYGRRRRSVSGRWALRAWRAYARRVARARAQNAGQGWQGWRLASTRAHPRPLPLASGVLRFGVPRALRGPLRVARRRRVARLVRRARMARLPKGAGRRGRHRRRRRPPRRRKPLKGALARIVARGERRAATRARVALRRRQRLLALMSPYVGPLPRHHQTLLRLRRRFSLGRVRRLGLAPRVRRGLRRPPLGGRAPGRVRRARAVRTLAKRLLAGVRRRPGRRGPTRRWQAWVRKVFQGALLGYTLHVVTDSTGLRGPPGKGPRGMRRARRRALAAEAAGYPSVRAMRLARRRRIARRTVRNARRRAFANPLGGAGPALGGAQDGWEAAWRARLAPPFGGGRLGLPEPEPEGPEGPRLLGVLRAAARRRRARLRAVARQGRPSRRRGRFRPLRPRLSRPSRLRVAPAWAWGGRRLRRRLRLRLRPGRGVVARLQRWGFTPTAVRAIVAYRRARAARRLREGRGRLAPYYSARGRRAGWQVVALRPASRLRFRRSLSRDASISLWGPRSPGPRGPKAKGRAGGKPGLSQPYYGRARPLRPDNLRAKAAADRAKAAKDARARGPRREAVRRARRWGALAPLWVRALRRPPTPPAPVAKVAKVDPRAPYYGSGAPARKQHPRARARVEAERQARQARRASKAKARRRRPLRPRSVPVRGALGRVRRLVLGARPMGRAGRAPQTAPGGRSGRRRVRKALARPAWGAGGAARARGRKRPLRTSVPPLRRLAATLMRALRGAQPRGRAAVASTFYGKAIRRAMRGLETLFPAGRPVSRRTFRNRLKDWFKANRATLRAVKGVKEDVGPRPPLGGRRKALALTPRARAILMASRRGGVQTPRRLRPRRRTPLPPLRRRSVARRNALRSPRSRGRRRVGGKAGGRGAPGARLRQLRRGLRRMRLRRMRLRPMRRVVARRLDGTLVGPWAAAGAARAATPTVTLGQLDALEAALMREDDARARARAARQGRPEATGPGRAWRAVPQTLQVQRRAVPFPVVLPRRFRRTRALRKANRRVTRFLDRYWRAYPKGVGRRRMRRRLVAPPVYRRRRPLAVVWGRTGDAALGGVPPVADPGRGSGILTRKQRRQWRLRRALAARERAAPGPAARRVAAQLAATRVPLAAPRTFPTGRPVRWVRGPKGGRRRGWARTTLVGYRLTMLQRARWALRRRQWRRRLRTLARRDAFRLRGTTRWIGVPALRLRRARRGRRGRRTLRGRARAQGKTQAPGSGPGAPRPSTGPHGPHGRYGPAGTVLAALLGLPFGASDPLGAGAEGLAHQGQRAVVALRAWRQAEAAWAAAVAEASIRGPQPRPWAEGTRSATEGTRGAAEGPRGAAPEAFRRMAVALAGPRPDGGIPAAALAFARALVAVVFPSGGSFPEPGGAGGVSGPPVPLAGPRGPWCFSGRGGRPRRRRRVPLGALGRAGPSAPAGRSCRRVLGLSSCPCIRP